MIGGFVMPGFEAVRDEFAANFARGPELGAACAAYHRGVKVVDLWGGYRDSKRRGPWLEDTLVGSDRVASIKGSSLLGMLLHARAMPARMLASFLRPSSLTARVFGNPRLRGAADLDAPAYRAVEIPAGGGIGQVRSIARVYSEFATGGRELGLSPETMAELTAPARPPSAGTRDLVLMVDASFSLGFARPSEGFRFGSSERAFGHPGAGGSFAFADPDIELSFAYAPNRLGHHLRDDPREKALRDALYSCVRRASTTRLTQK